MKIRYGMVGGSLTGMIGDVHRKALNIDEMVELVAGAFSPDQGRNKATGEACKLDSDRVYDDYKTMAKTESSRADGIDFVVVVTPNDSHYGICKAFLEAGIHVICDKPLCLEVWEAEELEKLSELKNLLFGLTYTYVGYTTVKIMREMVQKGVIGDIVSVNAEYVDECMMSLPGLDANDPAVLSDWRMDPKRAGVSSCVADIGTHIEYTVHYITGLLIKRLVATANTYGHVLDLNANMIIEYENGVNGAYWCSNVAAGKLNGLLVRIYGTKGSLEWDQHYPDYIRYTPVGKPPQILSRGCGYLTEEAASNSRLHQGSPEGTFEAFANLYKNMVGSIIKLKNGETPTGNELDYPTVKDGLNGIKFVHAFAESAKNNSVWVNIN